MKLFLGRVLLIGVLLALWEIASQTIADEFFISRPTVIAEKFVALVVSGLSGLHRRYLAAGGYGFIIGDGALRYGPEVLGEILKDKMDKVAATPVEPTPAMPAPVQEPVAEEENEEDSEAMLSQMRQRLEVLKS